MLLITIIFVVVFHFSTGLSPMQRLEWESKGTGPTKPRWINPSMWRQCQHLEALFPVYDSLCRSIVNNHSQWQIFADSPDPYTMMQTSYQPTSEQTLFNYEKCFLIDGEFS